MIRGYRLWYATLCLKSESKVTRPVKNLWWEGENLYTTYADGAQETVCFEGPTLMTTNYGDQDALIVENSTIGQVQMFRSRQEIQKYRDLLANSIRLRDIFDTLTMYLNGNPSVSEAVASDLCDKVDYDNGDED